MTIKDERDATDQHLDLLLHATGQIAGWLPIAFGLMWLVIGTIGMIAATNNGMSERSGGLVVAGAIIVLVGTVYRRRVAAWFDHVARGTERADQINESGNLLVGWEWLLLPIGFLSSIPWTELGNPWLLLPPVAIAAAIAARIGWRQRSG